MENFRAIEYHQKRDFSRKMNATFEFIRQNFKALVKSILFIAGPPVLIVSILMGSFMGDMMSLGQSTTGNPEMIQEYFMSVNFWVQVGVVFVFLIVSGVMTIATINNYIILYGEKQTNKIEVHEVWERVRTEFWMYLGTMCMFALLGVAVYIVLAIPAALLIMASPVLTFLAVLFFLCAAFYLLVCATFTFFIRSYEKKGFFESVVRSFRLIQGKWWSTFGLIMVLYIVAGIASYIFMIPWYAITIVSSLHSISTGVFEEPSMTVQILGIVFFTLYYLAQTVLNTLPNVGIAFQYFNLVELKEAKGLMGEIEKFGEPASPSPSSASQEEQY